VLGRYRIVAPLARGGMGIVYLGRIEGAAGFAKPVVIKTVIPDARDVRAAQLFVREARILSNLQHPAIVGVLDFGQVDGEYIMVLEYVHGFHLGLWSRYVREARGTMAVAHAVEVCLPVLEALEFAHRLTKADGTPLGIVHRDVSPANILIDQVGHVKLHDFGIARMADDEFKTSDGTFRGTLSFTAPETLQGISASPRSDLYACGVILYQLIAGQNPFRGDQPSETLHRVMTHKPPALSHLRADVPPAIDAAIARAMAKDPAARFDSAEAFAAALRSGRTWSAQEMQLELCQVIQKDFNSPEMPKVLGVETLQSRDAAWRAAQPPQKRIALSSSPPPARDEMALPEPATMQATSSANLADVVAAQPTARPIPPVFDPGPTVRPVADPASVGGLSAQGEATKPANRSRIAILAFAVAGVLGAGAAALAFFRRAPAETAPKFVLIEKQSDDADTRPASSTSGLASEVAPPAASEPPAASSRPASASSTVKAARESSSAGSTITAAFQRQRGRIEACFRANGDDTPTPQLTIRFQVEPSGQVRSAELSPASVAGSTLGACLVSVARSTRFPSGEAPISFVIPITARRKGG